jgi:putative hydrolase of the HAD superfamily
MQRYKAILWDFGGVLTTSPFDAFNRYEAAHGLPRDFIRGINARNHEHNAWALFESSRCSLEEFDRLFEAEARAAGHALPGRVVLDLLGGDVRPRMVQLLERCRRDWRVSCLTNNVNMGEGPGMWRSPERAAQVAAVMALFDFVIESSREGLRKPDPRIYALACERMGVAPSEVVYLDDLGINLKPAQRQGMTTIKVTSEAQAIGELCAVLGLDFTPTAPPSP